jgi:hypothetical protein
MMQTRCFGNNLLQAIHGSERAAHARSDSLADKLAGRPVFLLRRSSANETLIVGQPKGVRFTEDQMEPMLALFDAADFTERSASKASSALTDFSDAEAEQTTLTLQSLPFELSRDMLLEALEAKGIAKFVDFVYVPFDFKKGAYCGWAYVNFSNAAIAKDCSELLNGFSDWGIPSAEPCDVSWCMRYQGLEVLTQHYRNSQLMHAKMNDEYKPAVYKFGMRVDFPAPTKKIAASRRNICRQRHFA